MACRCVQQDFFLETVLVVLRPTLGKDDGWSILYSLYKRGSGKARMVVMGRRKRRSVLGPGAGFHECQLHTQKKAVLAGRQFKEGSRPGASPAVSGGGFVWRGLVVEPHAPHR